MLRTYNLGIWKGCVSYRGSTGREGGRPIIGYSLNFIHELFDFTFKMLSTNFNRLSLFLLATYLR